MIQRPLVLPAAGLLCLLLRPGLAAGAADGGMCTQPRYSTTPLTAVVESADSGEERELDQKIFVEADSASMTREGLSQLMGSVRVRQGTKEISADNIDYDNAQQLITVDAESVFSNPELVIKSGSARFNLNDNSGVFRDSDFVLPTRGARGTSGEIRVATDGKAELRKTSYTTCPIDSNAWYLEASDIRLDQDAGLGTARHARLRFGGVPILYVPWFQFPLDDRRRSGLLFPTIGETNQTGVDLRWPVYLNLAPNYDATVTPRLMTRRGFMLGTSGRYLLNNGEGRAQFDYLEDDKVFGKSRSLTRVDHANLFSRNLGLEATFAEVSDPQYFEDLGGTFASSSITYLERSARLTYQSPASYRVTALVQNFQTIDNGISAIDDPYKRLPQIRFDALTRNTYLDTRAGLNAEYVNFVRDGASVEGQRLDLQPYLRYQRDLNAWYVSSQVDYRYTGYKLSDPTQSLLANQQQQSPSRALPVVSAEGGLRFDRITSTGAIQTLEPRVFALYVPYENQDQLPLFDTGEPDFDFTQLFARNRFFGEDRISDARNLTGTVTTRVIDPETGDMQWSASFGQLYRLEASRVALPGQDAPDSGATDFIGEINYNFLSHWSAQVIGQWSPDRAELERSNVALRYRNPASGSRFDIAYRDRIGLLEQTDVSFNLPVSSAWRIGARSRYSIRDEKTLESFVGASYETCCWAISAAYRRFITGADGALNNGIYFQLELKGLSRIGTGFASLLPSDDGDDAATPGALGTANNLSNNSNGSGRSR